jgi:hypothetical protein
MQIMHRVGDSKQASCIEAACIATWQVHFEATCILILECIYFVVQYTDMHTYMYHHINTL